MPQISSGTLGPTRMINPFSSVAFTISINFPGKCTSVFTWLKLGRQPHCRYEAIFFIILVSCALSFKPNIVNGTGNICPCPTKNEAVKTSRRHMNILIHGDSEHSRVSLMRETKF